MGTRNAAPKRLGLPIALTLIFASTGPGVEEPDLLEANPPDPGIVGVPPGRELPALPEVPEVPVPNPQPPVLSG